MTGSTIKVCERGEGGESVCREDPRTPRRRFGERTAEQDGRGEHRGGGDHAAGGQNTGVQGDLLLLRPGRRGHDHHSGVGTGHEDLRLESHRGRFTSESRKVSLSTFRFLSLSNVRLPFPGWEKASELMRSEDCLWVLGILFLGIALAEDSPSCRR